MPTEAKEVRLTEGDVQWVGQTVASERDGDRGLVLFGRDSEGGLHIRIVCDHGGAEPQKNDCEFPDGWKQIQWLAEWFAPRPPVAYATVMTMGSR